ncbi:carboxypeptidase-like regulatory domain-containing protein [Prolixibacteraceae bacterium JC049]|nr:carboxypeptidase-like regulatory domain-containing protein [Prolixibacteraceae bacterium JC049]
MPRYFLLSVLFFLLIWQSVLGEEVKIFKGKIIADNDTIPVAYAHIGVLHSGIGTVSNINGEFELKGSFNIKEDSLVVSHIEYEKRTIALKDLTREISVIRLNKNDYELGEVIVFPQDRVKEIFRNVIKNLKVNYPTKLYQCEAFYREAIYEEKTETYTRLLEAALNIQDGRVTAATSRMKCSVLQLRKSEDNNDEHWWCKLMNKVFSTPNNLYLLLRDNPVRIYKENNRKSMQYYNPLRSVIKEERNITRLSGIIKNANGDDIYHFCRKSNELEMNFYVNSTDYAIVQFDCELRSIQKKEYRFVKIDEKYYPAFFQQKSIKSILKQSKGLSRSETTLTFVNYSPDKRKFKRLKSKHVLPKTLDLYKEEAVYDEGFWDNYNVLLKNPIKEKIITDLSKEETLKSQFERTGNENKKNRE